VNISGGLNSDAVLYGLSGLKDDLSFSPPALTVTLLAELEELSSNGTYEAELLISGFPAAGAGDYDIKLQNMTLSLTLQLTTSSETDNLNVTGVGVGLKFEKMVTYLEDFRLGGGLVDWTNEEVQTGFQELVTGILEGQVGTINALVEGLLNAVLKV
jgi:hypothetical protein